MVAGTTTGVITDIDGNYKLEAPFGSSLQISYIGYTTQTVKAGQKSIIKMKEDSKTLEEVVVVGYGVMKKKDLTGAVASLKASDLEKKTTENCSGYAPHGCGRTFGRYRNRHEG